MILTRKNVGKGQGFSLDSVVTKPKCAQYILEAIAAGRTRFNEIKQATGLEGVSAYFKTLQELRLVERVVPVTESKPHKSRRGIYRLRDNFFRFWFRFVHPNRTLLEQGGSQVVLDRRAPFMDAFTGLAFEEVCRQFLWKTGLAEGLPFIPLRIGNWLRANKKIDLIAIGGDGEKRSN